MFFLAILLNNPFVFAKFKSFLLSCFLKSSLEWSRVRSFVIFI